MRQEVRKCRGRFVHWCNGISEYREKNWHSTHRDSTPHQYQVMD